MRPAWVKCIRRHRVDEQRMSWCGRDISMEWAYQDPMHAAVDVEQGSGRAACPECVDVVVEFLDKARWTP